jgi:hypothetical protein
VSRPPADEAVSKPLKRRRRVRQTVSLQDRLVQQAREDRVQARSLPPGREREELLRHARRAESASQMTEWLTFRPSKPLKWPLACRRREAGDGQRLPPRAGLLRTDRTRSRRAAGHPSSLVTEAGAS